MISAYSRTNLAKIIFICAWGFASAGCFTRSSGTDPELDSPISEATEEVSHEEIDEVINYVDQDGTNKPSIETAPEGPELQEQGSESLTDNIPADAMVLVQKWLDHYRNHPKTITRYLKRGSKYKPMIEKILRDQGLPEDLYYMALIESGFHHKARSHARAVGVWQFISGTAQRYGLAINYYADERIDPMRATIAAGLYLSDLNNVFQSWYLAMAAYNAGEMRILNAIMKANSRDYWDLVDKKALPRETRNYVPKFIAAAMIGKNPEQYGISFVPESPIDTTSIELPSPIALNKIAQSTGIPAQTLKDLNPHLRHNLTPPQHRNYKIWVPRDKLATIEAQKTALAGQRLNFRKTGKLAKYIPAGGIHKVQSGETLSQIARTYGLTVSTLKSLNGLTSSRININQPLVVSNNKAAKVAADDDDPTTTPGFKRYRVRRGDSLASISKRFGTSISKIKKLNRLNKSRIYAGQLLKIKKI